MDPCSLTRNEVYLCDAAVVVGVLSVQLDAGSAVYLERAGGGAQRHHAEERVPC